MKQESMQETIMKGNKNKGKNKELESLPPSSLVLACLLPLQSKSIKKQYFSKNHFLKYLPLISHGNVVP
jgi:hypothetical protein